MNLERILKPHEIIERLKNARKQLINGYYFILIRPDMRDRIIELLKESEKERIDIAHEEVVHPEPSCELTYITDCCCDLCGVQLIREDIFCRGCGRPIKWHDE